MKDFKKVIDKEVLVGFIVIIILGLIALFLLIRRETAAANKGDKMTRAVKQELEVPESGLEAEGIARANLQMITEETIEQPEEEEVILPLYAIFGKTRYKAAVLTERKQEDYQLEELYDFWDAYKLDAVEELVRLERMQKISEELKGKNKFYYHGSVDKLGRPSGKGLAVYEDNTYYFGEWKDGLRHGKGMWLEVAIYTEENQDKNLGVIEHSYSGEWSRDLPNGQGQEHFSYDYSRMKTENMKDGKAIANVIGEFEDGYYNGEMYIMTVDAAGNTTDWSGICQKGIWKPIETGPTTDSVWEAYEKDVSNNPVFHYLYPKDNKNYGIIGLKK